MYNKGKKIATIAMATTLVGQGAIPALANENTKLSDTTVDLRIMATTDLHANIMDHDYYTDKPNQNLGLSKTATLIEEARKEVDKNLSDDIDNSILLDNGDIIQGNPLASIYAMNKDTQTKPGQKYPVYEALDLLGYDATTLGNHEFNYGLDFLKQITDKSVMKTDVINANVLNNDGSYRFNPYKVINEEVIDSNGNKQTVKIGLTGFVPPQILNWDKQNLEGKVKVEDIKTAADKVTKTLKEKEGVDIVIALAHTGTGNDDTHIANAENVAYQLTKVEGMDVVIGGHSHSTALKTMNGVQVIQPLNWGKELGIIDLKLAKSGDKWSVVDEETTMERRNVDGKVYGEDNALIRTGEPAKNNPIISENPSLKAAHEKTIEYINSGVGKSTDDMNSFFSLVSDDSSVELVANAQKWYLENLIKEGQTELQPYKDLQVLSAAAPFKAGGRSFDDPTNFVDIKAGDLKLKDLSNLYIYDNTVHVLKVNGSQVKEWLEMCAGMFNTIDINSKEEQELLNSNYRSYNFDSIEGLTYEIDVTKDAKYDNDGNTINANSSRITNLKLNGSELDLNQEFLVVTNNYRATGNFPGVRDAEIIYSSAYENRETIVEYIKSKGTIVPSTDDNWRIKTVDADVNVVFTSHENGKNYLAQYPYLKEVASKGNNLTKYSYDLSYEHKDLNQTKLVGLDRYETAVKVSQSAFDKADNVVIVSSDSIVDGLCATPLATSKNAPVLLTQNNKLSEKTKEEIKRLGAKNVYIVGGSTVVNETVVNELKALVTTVKRVSGEDRYETSLAVAKELGDVTEVAVVNGETGLADAVSIAPVAGENNMPILLSSEKDGITKFEKYIKDEKVTKSYVIGGENAISNEVVSKLPNAQRLGGVDRNETNAKIIDNFYKTETLKNIFVAKDGMKNKSDLIDALAVSVVAAKEKSPVVIGGNTLSESQEKVLSTKDSNKITQIGGNGNEGIFNKIKNLLKVK